MPLVYELPEEEALSPIQDRDADLVAVYSTYNPTDVMMIKSLLDAEEIVYNFQGELFEGSGVFIVQQGFAIFLFLLPSRRTH